jgi:hypothetical protein
VHTSTDADGEAVQLLDAGTYKIFVRCSGYSQYTAEFTVTASDTVDVVMAATVITPSTPPKVTGWTVVYDDDDAPLEGAVIQVNLIKIDGTGRVDTAGYKEETSDGAGLVQFTEYFVPGGVYQIRYKGYGDWQQFVADDATFELPNIRK